jgi:hypothetical protein
MGNNSSRPHSAGQTPKFYSNLMQSTTYRRPSDSSLISNPEYTRRLSSRIRSAFFLAFRRHTRSRRKRRMPFAAKNATVRANMSNPSARNFWWLNVRHGESGLSPPISYNAATLTPYDLSGFFNSLVPLQPVRPNNRIGESDAKLHSTLYTDLANRDEGVVVQDTCPHLFTNQALPCMQSCTRCYTEYDYRVGAHEMKHPYMLDRRPNDDTQYECPSLTDFYKHRVSYAILGANYIAPIMNPKSILDIGSSSIDWAIEMAEEWPNAQVVSTQQKCISSSGASLPPNCRLISEHLSKGFSFEAKTFDFIHGRYILSTIPTENWRSCFEELYRITSPGGWIQLTESDGRHLGCGPVAAAFNRISHRFNMFHGVDLEIIQHLDEIMREVGFVNIERVVVSLPVGRWGGQLGEFIAQEYVNWLINHRTDMLETGVTSGDELDWLQHEYICEMNGNHMSYYNVCIYIAQRPR